MINARRGDLVETDFDTGAAGYQTLYGVVVAAGPKTIKVQWESGVSNRLDRERHAYLVRPARNQASAREAIAESGNHGRQLGHAS